MKCGEDEPTGIRCSNEGCPRQAEPGERYCVVCGLERALYRRDRRPQTAERPGPRPDRR
jgi:hypothetical protein